MDSMSRMTNDQASGKTAEKLRELLGAPVVIEANDPLKVERERIDAKLKNIHGKSTGSVWST